MKERLQDSLGQINRESILQHAQQVRGVSMKWSEPFSAGQYWVCFELVADDNSLVIARARLPHHPDTPAVVTEEDEEYLMQCEVATMEYVKQKLPSVKIPTLCACASPGSQHAKQAGAPYMLIEGFYGNSLLDVMFDITQLPVGCFESRPRI